MAEAYIGKPVNNVPGGSGAGHEIDIRMHLAADSGGRVVWPEIHVDGREVHDICELRKVLGQDASVQWFLRTWAGSSTRLPAEDQRIGQDGFLLRLDSPSVRAGMKAECAVMA